MESALGKETTATPMYLAHWGLNAAPFRNCLDPRRFFLAPTHDEALARLDFLAEQRRRLGLLFGRSGCGKSLVLEVFARQLRRSGCTAARLSLLGMDRDEFLWATAGALGMNPDPEMARGLLWSAIADRLTEFRLQRQRTVLLLDDVQTAPSEVIQQVARLVQNDPTPESGLTVVLACHADQADRLGRRLLELAELRVDLEPWSADDTANYLQASLRQAGREAPVFDSSAAARIHDLADGVPRRVNQLADMALLAAAGQELEHIDGPMIDEVFQELAVVES
ncbi:MAG: AAA family ATPase [Planctomycetes bacterium]|nr:AAA family ATPase [Planctomycetota bacterium]